MERRPWPKYFQPHERTSPAPAEASLRLPACLLDIFRLRRAADAAAEMVLVVGCLGGQIDAITGAAIEALPGALRAQARAAEINQRGRFRTLTARELHLFALEASEQEMQAKGLNDAVSLHGAMQVQLVADASSVRGVSLEHPGLLLVGRLDLLHAARQGMDAVFQHAVVADERVYHLLVPAAPLEAIQRGDGLVLVYPFLDPATFAMVDNSFMLMRLVHGLLRRLQQDLRAEGSRHPFVQATIPVASRSQLEADLRDEGYEIAGDVGIRRAASGHTGTLLGRLRQFVEDGGGQRIAIPPQATPEEYCRIIDSLIGAVATPEDLAMTSALASRDSVQTRLAGAAPQSVAPTATLVSPEPRPPAAQTVLPPTPTVAPLTSQLARGRPAISPPSVRPRRERRSDWAGDFAATPPAAAPGNAEQSREEWRGDFADSGAVPPVRDARPELVRPARPSVAPEADPTSHWASDFDRPPRRDD